MKIFTPKEADKIITDAGKRLVAALRKEIKKVRSVKQRNEMLQNIKDDNW